MSLIDVLEKIAILLVVFLIARMNIRDWKEFYIEMEKKALKHCDTCAWCEYEFVKSDGSEDKRYRNHKWCGLHKRSTKKDGYCHWHMEKKEEHNEQAD